MRPSDEPWVLLGEEPGQPALRVSWSRHVLVLQEGDGRARELPLATTLEAFMLVLLVGDGHRRAMPLATALHTEWDEEERRQIVRLSHPRAGSGIVHPLAVALGKPRLPIEGIGFGTVGQCVELLSAVQAGGEPHVDLVECRRLVAEILRQAGA